jgi:hypothetical protein
VDDASRFNSVAWLCKEALPELGPRRAGLAALAAGLVTYINALDNEVTWLWNVLEQEPTA